GHGTGVLRMEDVDFDIDHPLRIHTHKRLPIPPRYLFVGLYRSDPDLDYYLDLDTPGGEPSVVRFPRSGPGTRYFYFAYDSLPEMLFSLAFRTIRMPRLPYQRSYGPGDWPVDAPKGAAMEKLDALVEKLGFQKLSFVGNTAPCYERGNAAISGYEPDAFGFSINVAAESDIEAKRLGALLEDHMGIQFSPD
ncbi:MAG TPA: hypothetical protein VEU33_23010, partial [Archangium sp.]|nr:hypothetical protein [Archangium sp.]